MNDDFLEGGLSSMCFFFPCHWIQYLNLANPILSGIAWPNLTQSSAKIMNFFIKSILSL